MTVRRLVKPRVKKRRHVILTVQAERHSSRYPSDSFNFPLGEMAEMAIERDLAIDEQDDGYCLDSETEEW